MKRALVFSVFGALWTTFAVPAPVAAQTEGSLGIPAEPLGELAESLGQPAEPLGQPETPLGMAPPEEAPTMAESETSPTAASMAREPVPAIEPPAGEEPAPAMIERSRFVGPALPNGAGVQPFAQPQVPARTPPPSDSISALITPQPGASPIDVWREKTSPEAPEASPLDTWRDTVGSDYTGVTDLDDFPSDF